MFNKQVTLNYEQYLKKQDGNKHVIMIKTASTVEGSAVKDLGVDEQYTNDIDTIISEMQEKGYQILDVQFILHGGNPGLKNITIGLRTLITYM